MIVYYCCYISLPQALPHLDAVCCRDLLPIQWEAHLLLLLKFPNFLPTPWWLLRIRIVFHLRYVINSVSPWKRMKPTSVQFIQRNPKTQTSYLLMRRCSFVCVSLICVMLVQISYTVPSIPWIDHWEILV